MTTTFAQRKFFLSPESGFNRLFRHQTLTERLISRYHRVFLKQICIDGLAQSILVVLIIPKIWAIRFYVAKVLPQDDIIGKNQ